MTGVTVHLANEDYDKGPIVAQRAVPVLEDDDIDALEARIHETEPCRSSMMVAIVSRFIASSNKNFFKSGHKI